eukprot:3318576-Prymnesium_polylepis.2
MASLVRVHRSLGQDSVPRACYGSVPRPPPTPRSSGAQAPSCFCAWHPLGSARGPSRLARAAFSLLEAPSIWLAVLFSWRGPPFWPVRHLLRSAELATHSAAPSLAREADLLQLQRRLSRVR